MKGLQYPGKRTGRVSHESSFPWQKKKKGQKNFEVYSYFLRSMVYFYKYTCNFTGAPVNKKLFLYSLIEGYGIKSELFLKVSILIYSAW